MKINIFVDTGASLHVVRKNVLTSGEKDTIRRSTGTTVTATANVKGRVDGRGGSVPH